MTPLHRTSVLLLLLWLAGCAGTSGTRPSMADMNIVARDDQFALVRLKAGQDLADLAIAFYGNAAQQWQLLEANANNTVRSGRLVAVPLQPLNATGIYPDGYRTLPILCYHQFTASDTTAHRLELSARAFEQQLRYLRDNNYQLLSFADVDEIMRAGRPIPKKAVVLTIDDGYDSVYTVAWPILKKYQARATLFIYTDFIGAGAALSWDQMREMADSGLIEIQSHAKSHTSLSRLPEDTDEASYAARLKREFDGSEAAFEQNMGATPRYLSYPYGNSSETAAAMLEAAGYNLAATVTRGDNSSFSDPYLLHRTMIYDDQNLDDFARLLRTYRRRSLQ